MSIPTITVKDLKERRDKKAEHFLLDVREKPEYETCKIEGSTLIPMSEIKERFAEVPKDKEVIVHCHHGGRSAQVAAFLIEKGVNAKNLEGGIHSWSLEIDSDVKQY